LKTHLAREAAAVNAHDAATRTELLGDFHVRIAELLGNFVLAELLRELISRCALITLMYQSTQDAECSTNEHNAIVAAMESKDEALVKQLMAHHLDDVERSLTFTSHNW